MKPFCCLLLLIGIISGRSETTSAPSPVQEVVIVFKTHFDIGYTDMASNVVRRYQTTMIDSALDVVDRNRSLPPEQQFAWTLPGWPVSKILEDWPGQSPERKARILGLLVKTLGDLRKLGTDERAQAQKATADDSTEHPRDLAALRQALAGRLGALRSTRPDG